MARPQFTSTVERPTDQALRNDNNDYTAKTETVSSGFEMPVQFDGIGSDERRVIESVSIRTESVDTKVQVALSTSDENGDPNRWMYGNFPEAMPMQFDPGVPVGPEGDQTVEVGLYHESGSDEEIRVVIGHRGER